MNKYRIKHIIIPKILWYITGRAAWCKMEDIYWFIFNKKPRWSDAKKCERMFCSYCGGKFNNKTKN